MEHLKVGDEVILLDIPKWLIHDLPLEEQKELLTFVGQKARITEIDNFGYFWIGFGGYIDEGEYQYYSGHSFAISQKYIKKASLI